MGQLIYRATPNAKNVEMESLFCVAHFRYGNCDAEGGGS